MRRKLDGKEYLGNTYGRLKIVDTAPRNNRGCEMVLCSCSCMQTSVVTPYLLCALLSGKTKTCGCRGLPPIGFTNHTKDGLVYTVISYIKVRGLTKLVIRFSGTGTECIRGGKEVRNGAVKDPNHPNIAGVGFIGEGIYKTIGSDKVCYQTWLDMIKRCYAPKLERIGIRYGDVNVCESWWNFQNFAPWYYDNFVDGWHVDKDFLVKGSRYYSEDVCVFLPPDLNSFLTGGLKSGIYLCKSKKVWVAQCQDGEITASGHKKQTYIGSYLARGDALLAYKAFKLNKLGVLHRRFKGLVPEAVFLNIADMISNLD